MIIDRKSNPKTATRATLRIEPVDNWSASWSDVGAHIEKTGKPRKLRVDQDGWLSARQIIVAAFVDEAPAAHVCFTINPTQDGSIEAKLDSHGIDPKFANRGIESQLHQAAKDRAEMLRCTKLVNFKFNSAWC